MKSKNYALLILSIVIYLDIPTTCCRFYYQVPSHKNSLTKFQDVCVVGTMLDYLIHFGSIATLNNTKSTVIRSFAGGRFGSNAFTYFKNILPFFKNGTPLSSLAEALRTSDPINILNCCFASARAYNMYREGRVFKHADTIARNNLENKRDWRSKQYLFCAWLTINTFFPFIIEEFLRCKTSAGEANYFGPIYPILADLSELYRQQLFYKILEKQIRNKKQETK